MTLTVEAAEASSTIAQVVAHDVAGPQPQVDCSSGIDSTRSSKQGLARMAAFTVFTALACIATDRLINAGLRRVETSSFGVFNKIVRGDVNAEILISGSSRALTHFDPRVIAQQTGLKTFNIGINGSQTDMQLAVLKTYLEHNTRPKLLVHSLDSYSFVTSRSGVYFTGQYLPYLDESPIYEALRVVDPGIWKARYLPLYGYAVEDLNFTWLTGFGRLLGRSPTETRYLGFEPRDAEWTRDFDRLKQSHPGGVRVAIEPEGVQALEDILLLCETRGIRVLLVYSPVYYEMQSLEINHDEVFGRFYQLARTRHVELWDYSRSAVSYNRRFFYNSQHLNAHGAAVFSEDFATALSRSPVLQ